MEEKGEMGEMGEMGEKEEKEEEKEEEVRLYMRIIIKVVSLRMQPPPSIYVSILEQCGDVRAEVQTRSFNTVFNAVAIAYSRQHAT